MTLHPAPHPTHDWPFMPVDSSLCLLCRCRRGSLEAQRRCEPVAMFEDVRPCDVEGSDGR